MAIVPRALVSWKIAHEVVSLHPEGTDVSIRDTRAPEVVIRFSLGGVNPCYAANLFRLFKGAIGNHLNEASPQQGCFLPLLLHSCPTPITRQLALFGYTTDETPPLQRWQWVILDETTRSITSLSIDDAQARCCLESLRLSEISSLPFHERSRRIDITATQNPSGQIIGINVKFKRADSSGRDALLQYLTNPIDPNHLKALKQLGLSPEQVKVLCTDDELLCFRALTSALKDLPEASAATVFENLEQYYPTLFPTLFQELIDAKNAQQQANAYPRILQALLQQVSGQEYASKAVAAALNAQESSASNAYFLFVGPTGVGKTEMAKAASSLKMNRMVRFDMDQFKQEPDSNKLFGSAAGYVGSTDKPLFAKAMDPYVHKTYTQNGIIVKELRDMVVLFDELEKAHEQVKQGLLTLFGEGYVQVQHTDDRKNIVTTYAFTKSLFTSTSNAYQAQIVQDFQRAEPPSRIAEHFTELNARDARNPLKYSPELLGRLHIVPFNPIPRAQFPELVRRKLPSLLRSLHEKIGCKTLTIADPHLAPVIDYLSNALYGDGTGIRRLLQYFDHTIYQNICEQAETWGSFKDKAMAIIYCPGEGLAISCKEILYNRVVREYSSVPVRIA